MNVRGYLFCVLCAAVSLSAAFPPVLSDAANPTVNGELPVGTIIPWLKPAQQIPHGWVACDGSSSQCPDLRGLFIRGSDRSGAGQVAGSDSHSHVVRANKNFPDGSGFDVDNSLYLGGTDQAQNVPRHITVLFIMKVAP